MFYAPTLDEHPSTEEEHPTPRDAFVSPHRRHERRQTARLHSLSSIPQTLQDFHTHREWLRNLPTCPAFLVAEGDISR